MVGALPSGHGEGVSTPPSTETWPPPHFPQPVSRPRPWLAIALVATAAVAVRRWSWH